MQIDIVYVRSIFTNCGSRHNFTSAHDREPASRTSSIYFENTADDSRAHLSQGGSPISRKLSATGVYGYRGEEEGKCDISSGFIFTARSCAYEEDLREPQRLNVSRPSVGAGATRDRNLFQRALSLVDIIYGLWIVVVYKFGGTLTDYKYRLSRSEYIINSFITATVINNCESRGCARVRVYLHVPVINFESCPRVYLSYSLGGGGEEGEFPYQRDVL